MGKFTKNVCEKCGRKFQNKRALSKHKCETVALNKNETCPICHKEKSKKNFNRHYRSCQKKDFFCIFGKIIKMTMKLVMAFNRGIKKFNYIGDTGDQKVYLYDKYIKERKSRKEKIETMGLKKNIKIINKDVAEMVNDDNYFNEKFNKRNISKNLLPLITETNNDFFPGISGRQVILNFLANNHIDNDKIVKKLNRKYKNLDYPIDSEIKKEDPQLYEEVLRLRGLYRQWKDKFDMFYFIFEKYKQDRSSFKCHYCEKILFREKRHLPNCKKAEIEFNKNKDKFVEDYIIRFYKYENIPIEKLARVFDKVKSLAFQNFFSEIPKLIYEEKKEAAEEEVKEKTLEEKRQLLERKKTNYWGKLFVKEVSKEEKPEKQPQKEQVEELADELEEIEPQEEDFQHFQDLDEDEDTDEEKSSEDNESKSELLREEKIKTNMFFYKFIRSKVKTSSFYINSNKNNYNYNYNSKEKDIDNNNNDDGW